MDRICMKIPQYYNIDDVLAEASWRCSPERDLILVYYYHLDDKGRIRKDGCGLYLPEVEWEELFPGFTVRKLRYVSPCPEWLSNAFKDHDP